MSLSVDAIHALGAKRHGAVWLRANQRCVEALGDSVLKPWDRGVKDSVAMVLLRVLDGIRLDAGEEWRAGATEWTPRREGPL